MVVLGGEAVSNEGSTPVQEAKGKREEKSGVQQIEHAL